MTNNIFRIGIVGAASLAGKELGDVLSDSSFAASSFTLFDEDAATGQMSAAGDEVSFIQPLKTDSFDAMDLVFFAGDAAITAKYWKMAHKDGAGTIDMTSAIEGEAGVLVRSPWVETAQTQGKLQVAELNLGTSAVIPAHPVATILALLVARASLKHEVERIAATVLEPASQYGRAAMDELHQQTVGLLSFQKLPREIYDAQVAFNLLPAMGEEAKIRLADSQMRIETHYKSLVGGGSPLALQLLHAPVFHGYVISAFVELAEPTTLAAFELSLVGEHVTLLTKESDPPSNLSATGQDEIMVMVEASDPVEEQSTRFKLLIAADNLKIAAIHAIACARELAHLRPLGKVQ